MPLHTATRWIAAAASLSAACALVACSNWPQSAEGSAAHETVTLDQERALAGDRARGDAPGYPITLAAAGMYRLASDLVVPAGRDGIVITGAGVKLDLNGFTIRGPLECEANHDASTCMRASGTEATGIHAMAPGTVVRNGHVRGFNGTGVQLDAQADVEDLEVSDNFAMGVHANTSASRPVHLRRVRATRNRLDGFWLQTGSIQQASAEQNGRSGFALGALMVRQDIAARGNRGFEGDLL